MPTMSVLEAALKLGGIVVVAKPANKNLCVGCLKPIRKDQQLCDECKAEIRAFQMSEDINEMSADWDISE